MSEQSETAALPEILEQLYDSQSAGDGQLTLNIPDDELRTYLEGMGEFFSNDEPVNGESPEQVQNRIEKLLQHLSIPHASDEFTSLAYRWDSEPSNSTSTLWAYGELVVVVRPSVLAETWVFGGDTKNLSGKLLDCPACLGVMKGDAGVGTVRPWLDELWRRTTSTGLPRLCGNYAEARLFRRLTVADVEAIYRAPRQRGPRVSSFRRAEP